MTRNLRLAVAGGTMTVMALVGGTLPSASADDAPCDTDAMHAAVVQAQSDVALAKRAFQDANRPLGHLVAAKHKEARKELAQSKAEVRSLKREAHSATSPAERKAVRDQLRAERHDIARADKLLYSKRATLAAIRADRAAARGEFTAARATLRAARHAEEDCSTSTESEPEPTDSAPVDPAPVDPAA